MPTESIRVDRANADEERKSYRADSNATDEFFGETKSPA
jgi:hypothetical protein